MWNSWLVLAACAVITQSLPRPDGAYRVPAVPANKRVQYYVLHDDGTFKYGHDTGAGAYESAMKVGDLTTGSFGFTNAESENVRVDYTAGVDGFIPIISHSEAEIPVEVAQPVAYSATKPAEVPHAVVAPVGPVEPRGDASYSFAYVTGDSDREEASDADLNVRGKYTFVAPDGIRRVIAYRAGSGTGFVAEESQLPLAPVAEAKPTVKSSVSSHHVAQVPTPTKYAADAASVADINSVLNADGSYRFSYNALSSSRDETADSDLNVKGSYSYKAEDGRQRTVNYIAGSDTGFIATGSDVPVPVLIPTAPVVKSQPAVYDSSPVVVAPVPTTYSAGTEAHSFTLGDDGTYFFNYNAGHADREESADSDLNVRGSYSYDSDGIRRRINYIAGSDTGFVATGDVDPAVSEAVTKTAIPNPNELAAPTVYSTAENSAGSDSSYKFEYKTGDSERKESSDADLNVEGSFSFTADDGVTRTVRYRAGSAIGFIADGTHLPVANDLESSVAAVQATQYNANAAGVEEATAAFINKNLDASYDFGYSTDHSDRTESADSDLNVKGSFSFVADDGIRRTVEYVAGSATGFVATGAHLPVAVTDEVSVVTHSANVQNPAEPATPTVYTATSHTAGSAATVESSSVASDASYKFEYKTGDSERKESADADLNVEGSFSFTADDGVKRTVRYRAGSATGFIADGTHLPVAHELPQATGVQATHYSANTAGLEEATAAFINQNLDRDASYNFAYSTGDSDRKESADSDLNVKGSFSFVADDGIRRTVEYVAGSATGFVATGAHLPVAEEASVDTAPHLKSAIPIKPILPVSPVAHVSPVIKTSDVAVEKTGDSSYSFNYQTPSGSSSRDEKADSNLNVKGSFKFIADDGVERSIKYTAGSSTGFVAEGAHLPTAVTAAAEPAVPLFRSSVAGTSTAAEKINHYTDAATQSGRGSVALAPGFRSVTSIQPEPSVFAHHSATGGTIVGNVLLHQYAVKPGKSKFGYAFSAI